MADNNEPNQTANGKYYSSGDQSAVRRSSVDRKGRPGEPVRAINTPVDVPGDRDTDKYYRNGGSKMQRQAAQDAPLVATDSVVRPAAGQAYATHAERDIIRPLLVRNGTSINIRAAIEQIVSALLAGTTPVLVHVASAGFESDIRTGLDIRVARQVITRDQYRDVQFALLPSTTEELAEQTFGKIDPATVPAVKLEDDEDDKLPDDFAAFVKGDQTQPAGEPGLDYRGPLGEAGVPADAADDADMDMDVDMDVATTPETPETPTEPVGPSTAVADKPVSNRAAKRAAREAAKK